MIRGNFMGKPETPDNNMTRCQAITDIIESVALEQSALAAILEAESDKLDKIIGTASVKPQELLEANKSVRRTIDSISRLELILQAKLGLFEDCICETCHRETPKEEE